jgi:hypothetical protein
MTNKAKTFLKHYISEENEDGSPREDKNQSLEEIGEGLDFKNWGSKRLSERR